ncbi:UNVERIFIED_CONTAM: hypothetical protein Slati_3462300 [Sesamum latifolium]|uniref:Retrovirus-related Pol polyprotein from transposon TNT 1-94-like beta-barrel domain-containing protein n=1 Tax=Sesamum latifolium TaxID=2727402 RepID=A0AAW2UG96_9LAMI
MRKNQKKTRGAFGTSSQIQGYSEKVEKVKVMSRDMDEDTNEEEHMQEAKVDMKGELETIPTMKKEGNHYKEAVENKGKRTRLGHFAWECQDAIKDVKKKANIVDHNQEIEESTLLRTIKEEEKDNNSLWYLDNDASNHICGHKDQFVELDEKVRGNVFFRNSSNIHIEGK